MNKVAIIRQCRWVILLVSFVFMVSLSKVAQGNWSVPGELHQKAIPYEDELIKQYEEYFRSRFGEEGNRPDPELLESRCLDDLEHHLALLHYFLDLVNREHYHEVIKLLVPVARKESMPRIEHLINASYNLSRIILQQLTETPENRTKDIKTIERDAWYFQRINYALSKIWLDLYMSDESIPDETKARFLLSCMRKDGSLKLSLWGTAMAESLGRYDNLIKDDFYELLISEDIRYKELNFNSFATSDLHPDLELMFVLLEDPRYTENIRSIFRQSSGELGRKFLFEDIYSGNHPGGAINTLIQNHLSDRVDDQTREEVFSKLEDYLRKIQDDYANGIYPPLGNYKGSGEARVRVTVVSTLIRLTRQENNQFIRSKLDQIEHHLRWVKKEFGDRTYHGYIPRIEATIAKWREEQQAGK